MSTDNKQRVKVWNTFFSLSREHSAHLKKIIEPNAIVKPHCFSGGILDEKQILSLEIVAWCLLALQAREAHLIDELRETHKISNNEAEAVHFLNIQQQWAILPKLLGLKVKIDFSKQPHQVIAQLSSLRNNLFHVTYDKLLIALPSASQPIQIFNHFVEAMEDMNVILKRHRKHHRNILDIRV